MTLIRWLGAVRQQRMPHFINEVCNAAQGRNPAAMLVI